MSEESEIPYLSNEFTSYLLDTVRIMAKLGYNPSRFHQMITAENDGVTVARRLVLADAAEGLWRLHELGRLDLSVEMSILLPKYAELFDEPTRERAQSKLSDLGFNVDAHLRELTADS